ncbi:MAG: hybrid sensor histidine kinase/response regulator [Psychrosphaera sp.]|nr:hybrid sensor histidine kinase/response regulator [Psychrosphaera sp.]
MNELNNSSILIVDDNPINIDLLRHFLTRDDYKISAVTSGEKALKLIARVKPDLILLDIMMPGIDGYETCRRLKADNETASIPVIFVTAKTAPEDIRLGFSVGASDYITKPVQQEEVLARVVNQLRLLEKSRMDQEQLLQSEKLSALGGFVSSIAHEISTPLGTLNTALSFTIDRAAQIKEDFDNKTLRPADLSSFLDNINEALQISQTNIESASQILHSFKLVAVDQCHYVVSRFNLREYIDNIVLSLKPNIKQTPHQVVTSIPADIEVNNFPGALSQIIIILINNSLMHGYKNDQNGKMEISAITLDKYTELVYRDDGSGIEAELLKRVFEPYYTTKAGKGGSGLGMGIMKKLVEEDLEGSIDISSRPGEGLQVIIRFKTEK